VHPADDDPLTSPSFPRIAADDSRSYRRGRSDGNTGSHSIPAASDSQSHSRPYPAMPAANGLDAHSASYTHPAVNGLDYAAAPAMPPVPAADPYRQHSVSPASDSYPGRAANSDYAVASSDYPGTGSDYPGGYSSPASVGAGYLPPVGGSYPSDSVTAAYSSRSATSGGYPVQPAPSQLPPSQLPPSSAPASLPGYSGSSGYPGDSGSSGYPGDSGSSGYPGDSGSSGYPGDSGSSGYPGDSGSSGYPGDLDSGYPAAASYQSMPPEPSAYSGYPTASSGQHPAAPPAAPPTAEYSYPVSSDPGYPVPLPAASAPADYSGYQPPVQADHDNGYHSAVPSPAAGGFGVDPVQPGYPSAPYNAPYQQTGYPAPGYESDASYPADPYAVDPYGYPGYGAARLPGQYHAADPVEQPIVYERYDGPAYDGPGYDPQGFAAAEYAGHGYVQEPRSAQGWQDLSDDQPPVEQQRAEPPWPERPKYPRPRVERIRDGYRPDGYR